MDIAQIGVNHLSKALSGSMSNVEVSEWLHDGQPVTIYWKPLTGAQQKLIDAFDSMVERTCMTVKVRALDQNGRPVFAKTPIESLVNDYDYNVIRAIAFNMVTDIPSDADERIEEIGKE